ncbi:Nucleoside-diphosphate-sugar epimerase [Pedococcus cremeus]|uniref:Nucleoside-diphosphate-sugar epimerase n=1 Tax=Pedococcus cremeus TaxID=587636 RepID=A0A1H9RKB4_9MICO|nr:NAD(P)-dependent oxidoreductase [Pedococcus cremeus]SER73200.1 Nucleoside-diphosphate-sugar epimerase [Pedococcus cremeus]
MSAVKRVAVIGASGFIGAHVIHALREEGHIAIPMKGPRLPSMPSREARSFVETTHIVAQLRNELAEFDAVVNAAGNPDASSRDTDSLTAANGVLPGVLAAATAQGQRPARLVHVSSAVVQGRLAVLDASTATQPFSAYASSKVLGEELVRELAPLHSVIYRPPSVHAADRRVTRMTGRIARSALATVARPGSTPSPQALAPNVGSAIAFLSTCEQTPPQIVAHPWEGLSTARLMEALGGRPPREVPRSLAKAAVELLETAGRALPQLSANARRIEMLWFGQSQARSWLTDAGWQPAAGLLEWEALGRQLRDEHQHISTREGVST